MPVNKLSIQDFAAKIKAKYPDYKDINDTLLTQKIVEKYPEYKDMVNYDVQSQLQQHPKVERPENEINHTSIHDIRHLDEMANRTVPEDQQIITNPETGIPEENKAFQEENKQYGDQFNKSLTELGIKLNVEPEKLKGVINDFPDEHDEARIQQKATLKEENPETYDRLKTADANKNMLAKKSIHDANEYNQLQGTEEQPIQDLQHLTQNIDRQREIIYSNLSGAERGQALANLEKNRSASFNASNPEIQNEYANNEDAKSQMNVMQYAGLKHLQAFNPQKYQLYSSLLKPRENTQDDTVEMKIGMEKAKKELLNIGRRNTEKYINEKQYDLDKEYKAAQTQEEKDRITGEFLKNKGIVDAINQDEEKDATRFPYLKDLEFERQAMELSDDPAKGVLNYALSKFGKGIGSAKKSIENVEVNALGTEQDIADINLQRLGESAKEENEFYLPEGSKSQASPMIYQFDKGLQDAATKIKNDKSLSDDQRKQQLVDLVKNNQDQVHTISNTANYGKSANFFSKATVYKNAGMIGDIASIAVQAAGGNEIGLSKLVTNTLPMYLTTQNDFYKQALEEGRSNPMEYANTHAAIMMAAGAINPNLNIVKRALGQNTQLGKVIAGVSENTWNDIVSANKPLVNKIKNSLIGAGKEAAKIGLTYGAGTSIAKDLADKGLFGKNMDAGDILNNAVKATKEATIGSVALLGLHAITNFKTVSPEEKARVWEIGDNPKLANEQLDDAVKKGEIGQSVADQRKQVIKTVSKLIQSVPTEDAKGRPLTDQKRADYLYNLVLKNKIDDIKGDLPDAQKEKLEAIQRGVDIDNNAILDPKSEKENLMQRKRELTEELKPGEDGTVNLTPLEKKTKEQELEEINSKLEEKKSSISVIQPEQIKHPETITIKPQDNAIQQKSSVNLPENSTIGKQNDISEREQENPGINRETTANTPEKISKWGIQKSIDWLHAIAGDNPEKARNSKEELLRGQNYKKEQGRNELLANNDIGGKATGAPGNNGGDNGTQASADRTRPSQGQERPEQQSAESNAFNSIRAHKTSSKGENNSPKGGVFHLSEAERESVVGKVRQLSDMPHDQKQIRIARDLLEMLASSIPDKKEEIVDLIHKTINENVTLPKPQTSGIFSHSPEGIGVEGGKRERMGQSQQGNETPGIGTQEENKGQSQKVSNDDLTGITHAETDKTANQFGLDTYEKNPETVKEWDAEADKRLKEDPSTIPKLIRKLEEGHEPDKIDQRVMMRYMASLKAKIEKTPTNELLAELKHAKDLSDIMGGREIAKSLVARKGLVSVEDSLADYMVADMESAGVDKLTETQKKQIKKEYEDIQAAKAELDKKIQEFEEQKSKAKAEQELKKAAPRKKGEKKTHEEYTKDRKDILAKAREDLLKVGKGQGGLTSSIPGLAQIVAIAPHVKKMVESLVSEGIDKLEDVVKSVHEQFKDIVPDITEKNIHDIIAGEYNTKKVTKNEINAKIRSLQTLAKLQNRLEDLDNGIEPKTEKGKIDQNKEITELKKKISEHPLTRLAKTKNITERQITELQAQLQSGDFSKAEKEPIELDEEAKKLKDKLNELRQDREIRLLKQQYANRTGFQKAGDAVAEVLNVPRSIMSSLDFSAPLRQGLFGVTKQLFSRPGDLGKQFSKMFEVAFSQKKFDRWFSELKDAPDYETMQRSGLPLSDPHDPKLSVKEEAYMSNLAEKIPIIGRFIKGSERAYVTFLNKMRVDLFRRAADTFASEGKTFENSPELYKAYADYVGAATGRGRMPEVLEKSAPILNAAFFSPRLIASRLNLLTNWANPKFYTKVPKEIRVQYFKDMAKFIGLGISILALAKAGGAEVEDDPHKADFGKIKSGNTRWDIWGGFQQYITLAARLISGPAKTSTGKPAFGQTRWTILERFARGKLAPIPGSIVNLADKKDVIGKPTTLLGELKKNVMPLVVSDIIEAAKDKGVQGALTIGIPAMFGVGVQTYDSNVSASGKKKGDHHRNTGNK